MFDSSNLCRKPYCWLHCQLKRDIDRKFWQSFLFSPPLADCDIFNQFGIVLTKLCPSFAWLFFSSFSSILESLADSCAYYVYICVKFVLFIYVSIEDFFYWIWYFMNFRIIFLQIIEQCGKWITELCDLEIIELCGLWITELCDLGIIE